MSCTNCGSAFHERWVCPKPLRKGAVSGEAITGLNPPRKQPDVQQATIAKTAAVDHRSQEATIASPPSPKRGRPKIHPDRKAYKADHERQRRKKAKT